MKTLKEIFEELNKPKNKLEMISKLIKEQETKKRDENDEQSELSK
jgi:hypothetical protein